MATWRRGDNYYTKRVYWKAILLTVVALAIIGGSIAAAVILARKTNPKDIDRLECPGVKDEIHCTDKGCLWDPVENGPSCYIHPKSYGYKVASVSQDALGQKATLEKTSTFAPYGETFATPRFEVKYITEKILRFKFVTDEKRYKVPVPFNDEFPSPVSENLKYEVVIEKKGNPFHFKVKRKDKGTVLWDTSIGGLVLSEQFLQISTYLPSKNIYGLGENPHHNFRHDLNFRTWPLFARDQFPLDEEYNLYGVHPFYTCLEENGKSHGVFLVNSNAMEYTLLPAPALTFRTIGGELDFFMFVGDDPEEVVRLYTDVIGRPLLPPYWGLGFQMCRYGYNSLENLQRAVNRTRAAFIPQDVQYADIDYMDARKDFTWDHENFADLPGYMKRSREETGLRWIVILDPAIEAVKNYETYERGVKKDVFIKWQGKKNESLTPEGIDDKNNYIYGKVWPDGPATFPDYFRQETKDWWTDEIRLFYQDIKFHGLWIDMNEPANFGTNQDIPWYCPDQENPGVCYSLKCPISKYDDPPYLPVAATKYGDNVRLADKTICMNTVQGSGESQYSHYDVHSLYGWSQTEVTLRALEALTEERGLVISRSTYPSSGRFAGHWLGDNHSRWVDLHRSIIGMLEFNLFGIPYVGADICGFLGNTTTELCKRWMQLGAFYPYSRNHNTIGTIDQDPNAPGLDISEASRIAMERRYTLLPYLYTLLYKAHTEGSTVVRPLFHEYPTDSQTWGIDTQFMWGPAMIISPVLTEGQTEVKAYLPNDTWYRYNESKSKLVQEGPGEIIIKDIEETPVHVRGGFVIPIQGFGMNTDASRKTNFQLLVFPKKANAYGELFWDDGVSKGTVENKKFLFYTFHLQNCSLSIEKKQSGFGEIPTLGVITVFNSEEIKKVFSDTKQEIDFQYIPRDKILRITVNGILDTMKLSWKQEKQCI